MLLCFCWYWIGKLMLLFLYFGSGKLISNVSFFGLGFVSSCFFCGLFAGEAR